MMGWGQGFAGGMGGLGLVGGFFGLLVFLGIVAAIGALVIWIWPRSSPSPVPYRSEGWTAIEELQTRYARGELTRDEFLRVKEDLT